MIHWVKRFLRQVTPPFVIALLSRRANVTFLGNFASWEEAEKAASGYDAPNILQKVRASALKVKNGEAAFERDSVIFQSPSYRWPLVACLLLIAQRKRDGLHVADFGGSLASTYYQHRLFLEAIPELKWSIIEQPHYVACGISEFQNDIISFFEGVDGASSRAKIDVFLISGSLQVVANPYAILQSVSDLQIPYILFDRLPLTDKDVDQITVQHVREPIYNASYAHRVFARAPLLKFLDSLGYSAELSFDEDGGPEYFGFLFSLRNAREI